MNTNREIYFIRHGQSVGNIDPNSDITDSPLTEFGRMQASMINLEVDLIICSPMRRALETLHYSQINSKELLISDICREKICGTSDSKLLEFPELETDDNFNLRISELANMLLNLNYNTIGVVCHGCVIAALTGSYLNNTEIIKGDLETIRMIANGAVIPIVCCGSNW